MSSAPNAHSSQYHGLSGPRSSAVEAGLSFNDAMAVPEENPGSSNLAPMNGGEGEVNTTDFVVKLHGLLNEGRIVYWSDDGKSIVIPNPGLFLGGQELCKSEKWPTVHRQFTAYGFVKENRASRGHGRDTDAEQVFRHPSFYRGCTLQDLKRSKTIWKAGGGRVVRSGSPPRQVSSQVQARQQEAPLNGCGDEIRALREELQSMKIQHDHDMQTMRNQHEKEIQDIRKQVGALNAFCRKLAAFVVPHVRSLLTAVGVLQNLWIPSGSFLVSNQGRAPENASATVPSAPMTTAPQPTQHALPPVYQAQATMQPAGDIPEAVGPSERVSSAGGHLPSRSDGAAGVQPMADPSQAQDPSTSNFNFLHLFSSDNNR